MKKSSHASGFTLIEVMVSLTIMALVTSVAFAGLRIGLDSWSRGSKRIDDIDHRSTVERLLKRQLTLAYPMEFRFSLNDPPFVLFRGTGSRVEFIADYSLTDGASDFRKIEYVFVNGQFRYDEKQLFAYVPSADEELNGRPVASFSNMHFRYLARLASGESAWTEEWTYGMGLPLAVEVRINDDVIVIPLVHAA